MASAAAEKLIFEDNFNVLNLTTWQREQYLGGNGNEF